MSYLQIIKYIPLQQGLRPAAKVLSEKLFAIIKYIPLQQGLRHNLQENAFSDLKSLSIFHYNKD